MEFPRECERRFLCTLSGRRGSLLSRSDLIYRIWRRNMSHISYEGWPWSRADGLDVHTSCPVGAALQGTCRPGLG